MKQLQNFFLKNPELTVVGFAVLVRLVCYLCYPETTYFTDSNDYLNLADRLLNLNLIDYEGYRTPGYPLLIAIVLKNGFWITIIQHILGILTSLLIYRLIRDLSSNRSIAIISSLLYSTTIHVLFFEKGILTETLSVFLLTWFLYQLQKNVIKRRFKPSQFGLLSFILLLLVATKPFFIYVLPLTLVFLVVYLYKTLKFKLLKPTLVLMIPTVFFFLAWSQLNKENTGYFTITSYYGYNLAQQIVAFAEEAPDEFSEIRDIYVNQIKEDDETIGYTYYSIWNVHEQMLEKTGKNFNELSSDLSSMSKKTIINNPFRYLKQVSHSWSLFWGTKVYWDVNYFQNDNIKFLFKGTWYIQRIVIVALKIIFVLLFISSIVYCFLKKKIPINMHTFIFALVISGSVLQAMVNYSENYRFSFPFLPAIIIVLASYSLKLPVYLSKRK